MPFNFQFSHSDSVCISGLGNTVSMSKTPDEKVAEPGSPENERKVKVGEVCRKYSITGVLSFLNDN